MTMFLDCTCFLLLLELSNLLTGRLRGQPHRFATYPGVADAVQFAPEEPPDAPGGAIDGREQVMPAFFYRDPPEGQHLGADAATVMARPVDANTDRHLAHALTEAAEHKP